MNAVCAIQSNSFNVTSDTGNPVRTLVPVSLFLFSFFNQVAKKYNRRLHKTRHFLSIFSKPEQMTTFVLTASDNKPPPPPKKKMSDIKIF